MKVAERGRGLARTSPLVGMTANVVAQTQHEVRLDTVGNAECSVRTGKFKAPEGIPRPNGEDACGGSGNGRGGDGTGKRFKFKTKVEPFLYPYIKSVFQIATKTFYRALWVDGLHNIPPEGVPTLLAFNHGNGLGDPAVVMSCCPRMVRFVAKDTIFMDKNFGTLIAESGAIPIERRREWGDEANNVSQEGERSCRPQVHLAHSLQSTLVVLHSFRRSMQSLKHWSLDSASALPQRA